MKAFNILFFYLLLSSLNGFSQGGYRQNNYNGTNNRDYSNESTKPSVEDIEKYKAQQLDKIIEKLKVALTLDELQVIAIKNEIASNMKNVDIIIKKEKSEDDKKIEVQALMDKSEIIINSYLNKVQKEKYKVFVEESKSGKKEKKGKKTRGTPAKGEQSDAKDKTAEE
ncbi:hypothetical protein [Flavobacterium sp.]|uniref:hypothetical protein n=1 Tax=Flavobacterium sp. TaxID=239 RepID=UPI0025CD475E|nr:hypothetical protein [Flavobacterium sp.]